MRRFIKRALPYSIGFLVGVVLTSLLGPKLGLLSGAPRGLNSKQVPEVRSGCLANWETGEMTGKLDKTQSKLKCVFDSRTQTVTEIWGYFKGKP